MGRHKLSRSVTRTPASVVVSDEATDKVIEEETQELTGENIDSTTQVLVDTPLDEFVQNIAEPEPEPVADIIKNVSRCTHRVFYSSLPAGKTYTITDADKKDSLGMRKVENAIIKGYLERI